MAAIGAVSDSRQKLTTEPQFLSELLSKGARATTGAHILPLPHTMRHIEAPHDVIDEPGQLAC